jgi:hypothetical protein
MKRNTNPKYLIGVGMALALFAAVPNEANATARSVFASTGNAASYYDLSCWLLNAWTTNSCATSKIFNVPLPYDSAYAPILATAAVSDQSTSENISCSALGYDAAGIQVAVAPMGSTSGTGTQYIAGGLPPGVYHWIVSCSVPAGGPTYSSLIYMTVTN